MDIGLPDRIEQVRDRPRMRKSPELSAAVFVATTASAATSDVGELLCGRASRRTSPTVRPAALQAMLAYIAAVFTSLGVKHSRSAPTPPRLIFPETHPADHSYDKPPLTTTGLTSWNAHCRILRELCRSM